MRPRVGRRARRGHEALELAERGGVLCGGIFTPQRTARTMMAPAAAVTPAHAVVDEEAEPHGRPRPEAREGEREIQRVVEWAADEGALAIAKDAVAAEMGFHGKVAEASVVVFTVRNGSRRGGHRAVRRCAECPVRA